MHASDARSGAVEVEVEAPQRGAEGVREARGAFVVEGVGLAEDEGDAGVGEEGGFVELMGDARDSGGVVH